MLDDEALHAHAAVAERVVQRREREAAALDDEAQRALLPLRDEAALERLHAGEDHEHDRGCAQRGDVHAAARREADAGHGPQARGRRQPAHHFAAQQDRAGAEKADARHHLRGDPRRIEHDACLPVHVGEAEDRDEHHERGADAHQHVRAQARGPVESLALEPDHAAEQRGEQQASEKFDMADHRGLPFYLAYRSGAMCNGDARGVPGAEARACRMRAGSAACAPIMRRAFFSCHRR
ncbi:hypothetical protein BVI434_3560015 [Burkholderia vietnamiensis]|nr:hypothetical protein BVI434_3560015 [Burkholderia vietnamiensis]